MAYTEKTEVDRFPLWKKMETQGCLARVSMELTERCNNNCLHCCVNLPADDEETKKEEITFREIRKIADEAARLGCLSWRLTGGEPLLREDFSEVYLYLKKKGIRVTIFTNATLVDSKVASLFKRYPPQSIEVTMYGLSQRTYEAVTRCPGSFEAFGQGINLLKENCIPFTLKTAALPQNLHEVKEMRDFAQSFTGQPLGLVLQLNLDSRPRGRNRSDFIEGLRLPPDKIMEILKQDGERYRRDMERFCQKFLKVPQDEHLFSCGAGLGACHIDAYNNFQLCLLLRHPDCIYSLRQGSLKEAWERFVPRVREIKPNNREYQKKCQRCFIKSLCLQCPAWSWIEHGVLDEPVEYLCEITHAMAVCLELLKKRERSWEAGIRNEARKSTVPSSHL